jgi:5-methylcytosine-specific restriction endonuclease McrA
MAVYSADNRDRENARARAWYSDNKERHQALCRKYQEENKESISDMGRAWREANKDKVLVYSRARKSRVRAAEGTWSFSHVEEMLIRQLGLCVYCGAQLDNNYHVDHIMPLYLGGSNWPANLQLLCQSCNLRKGRKHPDDFEREIGFAR